MSAFLWNLHRTCSIGYGAKPANTARRNATPGIACYRIVLELHQVIDDAPYSIERTDELAVRFHHRLVAAHRFRAATAGGHASQAI